MYGSPLDKFSGALCLLLFIKMNRPGADTRSECDEILLSTIPRSGPSTHRDPGTRNRQRERPLHRPPIRVHASWSVRSDGGGGPGADTPITSTH